MRGALRHVRKCLVTVPPDLDSWEQAELIRRFAVGLDETDRIYHRTHGNIYASFYHPNILTLFEHVNIRPF